MSRDAAPAPRITATDDETSQLLRAADPVIRRTLARARDLAGTGDLDDLHGDVLLRLMRHLNNEGVSHIASFDDYVAGITLHALDDFIRRRYPERTRLSYRLRRLIQRRADLKTWLHRGHLVVGVEESGIPRSAVDPEPDVHDMGAALDRILAAGPVYFQALVTAFAGTLDADRTVIASDDAIAIDETTTALAEGTALARRMWQNIEELPLRQRIALLLQTRDERGDTGLVQFLTAGVGPDAVARALGWTRAELLERWPDLPYDDKAIAALLGATRQQVINLRKCARERLRRNMKSW